MKKNLVIFTCLFVVLMAQSFAQVKDTPPQVPKVNPNNQSVGDEQLSVDSAIFKSAKLVLQKANLANGGASLDNIKTLRLKGRVHLIKTNEKGLNTNLYYNLTILVDVKRNWIRREIDAGSAYFEISQIKGNSDWVFENKLKRLMTQNEENNLLKVLQTGSLGLRKDRLALLQIYKMDSNDELKAKYFAVKINDVKHLMVFDKNSRLLVDDSNENQQLHKLTFDDFRKVKGIVFPFYERFVIEGEEFREAKYSSIEVNPKLTKKDWDVPK